MLSRIISSTPVLLGLSSGLIICGLVANSSDETIEVKGLEENAEIIVDRWGVPHIFTQTRHDTFFVQGFNAARDRLWQMDTWRRRGLGRLAEVLGKNYVAQDIANRLFLYRGDMEQEWFQYGPNSRAIAKAFTDGINAYLEYLQNNPERYPPEFQLLSYKPARWLPEDVVRIRTHGLWRNATSEVVRAQILCQHGANAATVWRPLAPHRTLAAPVGLDPCAIPSDVLDIYQIAKAPVSFSPYVENVAREDYEWASGVGSNNWVVSPNRTRKGSAILANDPHRRFTVPSVRYAAHLNGPGVNVIGAGQPMLPGISIGHNENIAFGLTIFAMDQEDLYYYAIDPQNPNQYRFKGGIETVRRIIESVNVRDGEPISVSLEYTRHGPVVKRFNGRLYALRAAWLEPGMAPYFGSLAYISARSSKEFVDALAHWGGPPENHVYADIEGNIGYQPAGLFPKRVNSDGLLPIQGNGRYEWEGFFGMDVLPNDFNPERGFLATANAMILPKDYPIDRYRIGFEWSSPWRQQRIENVLARQPKHTLRNSLALQHDYQSVLAKKILQKLPRRIPPRVRAVLEGWNGAMESDSFAAAFFSIWYSRHLTPAFVSTLFNNSSVVKSLSSLTILHLMDNPAYNQLVVSSMQSAFEECIRLMGRDPDRWRWGNLHRLSLVHPLYPIAEGLLKDSMELISYPRGGTGNTTNSNSFSPRNLRVRSGPSLRFVVDTGDWDRSRMSNAPGQSGDPRSKHYDNLLEDWANDRTFPLLFSREMIERNIDFRLNLVPDA